MRIKQERRESKSRNTSYDGVLHEQDGQRVLYVLGILCLIVSPILFIHIEALPVLVGIACGALGGYFVTPDADHMSATREEYRLIRRFGVLGAAMMGYLTIYAVMFRHRSKGSHSIFPGTPFRVLFITWPTLFVPIFAIVNKYNSTLVIFTLWYIAIFVGWAIQDMFHYKRDNLGWLGMKNRRIPRKA
jgi:uncharacterized metal-binding protein